MKKEKNLSEIMILDSKKELESFLKKEILDCNGKIVIQAGHFALVFDENQNKLIPGIYQDIKDKQLKENVKSHPYMGEFPLTTFKFGTKLANYAKENNKNINFAFIVNDWQFTPKAKPGKENKFRNEFYMNNKLPCSYEYIFKTEKLNESLIIPMTNLNNILNNKLYFEEHKLRNLYSRKYSKFCNLNDHSCAQEYLPFLDQLIKKKVRLIISFIPKTCKMPIIAGSKETKIKLKSNIKIINIFLN